MVTTRPDTHRSPDTDPGRAATTDEAVYRAAAGVTDPEMPMLTLADLGVLRSADTGEHGTVRVSITPTYSGCPALDAMRDDLRRALNAAGYERVEVRTVFSPPWSTDWISSEGRRKLAEHGLAPPGRVGPRSTGPVPLTLGPPTRVVRCPQCGCPDTEVVSRFGATACTGLRRCTACSEPFEHVKEI